VNLPVSKHTTCSPAGINARTGGSSPDIRRTPVARPVVGNGGFMDLFGEVLAAAGAGREPQ